MVLIGSFSYRVANASRQIRYRRRAKLNVRLQCVFLLNPDPLNSTHCPFTRAEPIENAGQLRHINLWTTDTKH